MSQNQYYPHCSLCDLIFKVIGILIKTIFILVLIGIVFEVILRINGVLPKPLVTRGLSATVPDFWTQWAMRPSVKKGPEYVWTNSYGLHEDRETKLVKENCSVLQVLHL